MHLHINLNTQSLLGASRVVVCPKCDKSSTVNLRLVIINGQVYGMFPVHGGTYVLAVCTRCGQSYRYDLPLDRVQKMTQQEFSDYIKKRVPPMTKFYILIGVLVFIVPVVSFIVSIVGFYGVYWKRTWWKAPAMIGMLLSGLSTAAFLAYLFLKKT